LPEGLALLAVSRHKIHIIYIYKVPVMGHALERVFLYPGDKVCDAFGVKAGDDRMMIRTLVNMLVWNLVAVLVLIAFY